MKSSFMSDFNKNSGLDQSFWERFKTSCSFYFCSDLNDLSNLQLKYEHCILKFIEDKENTYSYGIILKSNKNEEPLLFPLESNTVIKYCFNENDSCINFFWEMESDLSIMFSFKFLNQNIEKVKTFKEILERLLYQVKYKEPFFQCQNEELIFENIIYSPNLNNCLSPEYSQIKNYENEINSKSLKVSNKLKEIEQKLSKNQNILFSRCGELTEITNQSTQIGIFVIFKIDQSNYEIRVINDKQNTISSIKICEGMQYDIDAFGKLITWIINDHNKLYVNQFKFELSVQNNLSVLIPALILEIHQSTKKSKNNDWSQFYYSKKEINKTDIPTYQEYIDEESDFDLEFDITQNNPNSIKTENLIDNPILSFTQTNNCSNLIVTKQNQLENFCLYDYEQDRPQFGGTIDFKNHLFPHSKPDFDDNLFLQEGDKRMVVSGNASGLKKHIFYTDVETGNVINSYENDKIKDICRLGGKSGFNGNGEFLAIENQVVNRYDPRLKNGIAAQKIYKTKMNFNKMFGGPSNSIAISSLNGQLRLFEEVGKNAKNVIPSLLGDQIKFIDINTSGDFVLATCSSYILLLPTFQNGNSGFSKTFLKTEKPQPKILTINPRSLSRNKISEFSFKKAVFDEKDNKKESLIIGTANDFLVIWKLEDVLSGKCCSTSIKKINENLIIGKFLRNKDHIITALKHDLKIEKIQSSRKFK